jgi:tetratricopeptide (TPR) repeat protein
VTAQLISAADGTHLWSERYDRSMADVFAIQDEIAQSIAKAFRIKMAMKAGLRAHTPALPAYEAFLRGRDMLFGFTPDSWARAKGWFDRAIELDPAYADPHMVLGLGYLLQAFGGQLLRDLAPMIRAEAQRALALNPSDPQPHILLGSVAAAHDYDWNEAADRFRDALRATPASADTRWAYATVYLSALGRFDESAAEMERAVERDPLNAVWRAVWSDHLACAGKHDRAIEEGLKAVELDESHFAPHLSLGQAYLATGHLEQSVAAFERAHRAAPEHAIPLGLLAGTLVQLGDTDRAAGLIRQMGDDPLPVWGRVLYHLVCGEINAAADWFERMIQHREPFAVVYARAPIVKPLRESSRWRTLGEIMNLRESG